MRKEGSGTYPNCARGKPYARIEATRAVAITPKGQRAFRELFGAPFAIGVP